MSRYANAEKEQEGGKAVLAATECNDEALEGAKVGAGGCHDHAASRIWSSAASEAASPVARSRYPVAASAFAAAVMIARESLRSTRNQDPIYAV